MIHSILSRTSICHQSLWTSHLPISFTAQLPSVSLYAKSVLTSSRPTLVWMHGRLFSTQTSIAHQCGQPKSLWIAGTLATAVRSMPPLGTWLLPSATYWTQFLAPGWAACKQLHQTNTNALGAVLTGSNLCPIPPSRS